MRDSSGQVTGRTAAVPFKIANETPGIGMSDVTLVSPDPGAGFALWAQGMRKFHDEISEVASDNNMSRYLTGDDIAQTKAAMADSVCSGPRCAQPTSQAKIQYALKSAAKTGRTIGIDMVDEVTGWWGDTPTPTDKRWETSKPPVADGAFADLMEIMGPAETRPRITWSVTGIAKVDAVRNWTGNPKFSDYNGIYHDIPTTRTAYPC